MVRPTSVVIHPFGFLRYGVQLMASPINPLQADVDDMSEWNKPITLF